MRAGMKARRVAITNSNGIQISPSMLISDGAFAASITT
jgi:hypothetical protein